MANEQPNQNEEIVIEEKPAALAPSIGIGDLFQWLPVIERVIAGIQAVLSGAASNIPAIRIRAFGRRLTLGPIPVHVEQG